MTEPTKTLTQSTRLELTRNREKVWIFSLLLSVLSIIGMVTSSFNPGIKAPLRPGLDFTGGTQLTLQRSCNGNCTEITSNNINLSLQKINTSNEKGNLSLPNLNGAKIQILDNSSSILLRLPFLSAAQSDYVIQNLDSNIGPFTLSKTSIDTIGPTLGKKLLKSSLVSLFVAFFCIALYINFRYDLRYSILALFALAHDELIVCGIFSWLGLFYGIEVDSLFAVALLTIAGYSVNNTVVVFDRIRERSRLDNELNFNQQIDNAVSVTLTRTIYTSGTTLMPLVCILLWGGSTLKWFSVALSLGVIIGAWSSIALAPSLLSIYKKKPF